MRDQPAGEDFGSLLAEFERLSQDERLFFDFTNQDDVSVHATFRRADGANRAWSVWYPLDEKGSRQTCSKEHMPAVLAAFGVRQEAFAQELSNCLLLQAAYADEFIRQVSEILGPDAVRKCIRRTQDFMDEMRQAVESLGRGHEESASGTGDGRTEGRKAPSEPPLPPVVPRTGESVVSNSSPADLLTGEDRASRERESRKSRLRVIRN